MKKKIAYAMKVEVLRADGTREEMTVATPNMLVGAAAHCDVRVAGPSAAAEAVLLELVDRKIVAHAKSTSPMPTVRERTFKRLELPAGEAIVLPGAQIRVWAVPVLESKDSKRRRNLSSVALGIAILALPGFVYAALRAPDGSAIPPRPREPLALWDSAPVECKATAADQALVAGKKALALGVLQRESHPFVVGDGIDAVRSFSTAAACFRRGGKDADAEAASAQGAELRAEIESDYLVHRVRLEHALDVDDVPTAEHEVRVLSALTAGRQGPYAEWLRVVGRRLEVRARAPKPET